MDLKVLKESKVYKDYKEDKEPQVFKVPQGLTEAKV
jgi:hypothetical protein